MATVTHAGRTVILNSQGGWNFTPGIKPAMNLQKVGLARARRMKVKELATEGAVHSLSVTFVGTEAGWTNFKSDIADLYDGTIGTLSVPGEGTYENTVFTGAPSVGESQMVGPTEGGTPQHMYTIDLEISEL